MRFALLLLLACVACGGNAESTAPTTPPATGEEPKAPDSETPGNTESTGNTGGTVGSECANAESVLVKSGETITRPTGSVMRLELIYQGTSIGVRKVRGVDMIIKPSAGPFAAGTNTGYWADVVDASGAVMYTQLVRDPTRVEAPPSPGGNDWKNATVAQCNPKTILVDIPNEAGTLVIYGPPYGTQNASSELARFTMK